MSAAAPFSWIVPLTELPPAGRSIARTLTEDECVALARHAGIEGVDALAARGEVRPWGADGIEVEIGFTADVVQACVITLDPVPEHIEGAFTRRYLPGAEEEAGAIELAPDEEEPPEPLRGDSIDLGPALAEELILALDPYPRAPGAALPAEARDAAASASPFAVLERLKPKT